jgi:hypothetical protein
VKVLSYDGVISFGRFLAADACTSGRRGYGSPLTYALGVK